VKDEEIARSVLNAAPRHDDGSLDRKHAVDELAAKLNFDEAAARHERAEKLINKLGRPGTTPPDGQLTLPGFPPYGYEPDRLLALDEGRVIEQKRARPEHKVTEAQRHEAAAQRHLTAAKKKRAESDGYSMWAMEQLRKRRRATHITWDNYVRETGLWSTEPAEPESDEDLAA